MSKYTINFNNSVTFDVEGTLEDAKAAAVERMSYTQQKVTIHDETGAVVSTARWWGIEPDEDDDVLIQYGDAGFYSEWEDA